MNKVHQRIKPHFSIIAHSPDSIELRSGVWNRVSYTVEDETKSGNLYKFVQLLDGFRSLTEIAKLTEMSRSDAESIIDHLLQLDVLENSAATAFDYYADIYTPGFKSKQHSNEQIVNRVIHILSNDELSQLIKQNLLLNCDLSHIQLFDNKSDLMKLLESNDESWLHNALHFEEILEKFQHLKDSFMVLAFDQINPVLTLKFNRIATSLNISWIHAAIDGPFIFIGPTFELYQTACYECFETRVGINLREYHSYQKYKNAIAKNQILRNAEFPLQGILRNVMVSHLIMEVMNYILTGCNFTKNKVMSIYLPTMEMTFNEFLKVSNCQVCGSQNHRDDHQLYFDVQGLLRGVT